MPFGNLPPALREAYEALSTAMCTLDIMEHDGTDRDCAEAYSVATDAAEALTSALYDEWRAAAKAVR